LKDSIGPSNIFKKIRQEKLRKYEEDWLAKASKKGFVSWLPQKKMKSMGNLKTEEHTLTRTIVYSSDIKGLTKDLDHVSNQDP
jgi:hypothetical protein